MVVIGVGGRKQHGKDTLANFAIHRLSEMGFKAIKRHFADPLKLECATMLAYELDPGNPNYHDRAKDFFREMNDVTKKEKYRLLLQFWGTEFKRGMVCDSYWIDKMRTQLESDAADGVAVVFVPDMRFPNEARLVKELGGYNIRVQRLGMADGDGHASEHALDDYQGWDANVWNDHGLPELEQKAHALLTAFSALDRL
jgi:hypothetical protein